MRRIPWNEIKREYVQGIVVDGKRVYPSQRDLCAKYKINPGLLGTRAKKENWTVQREIFVSKVEAEIKQKTAELLSDEGSQFDLNAFRIAENGLKRIAAAVQKDVDAEDLNKLSAAAQRFHQMGRLALGESTENGKQQLNVIFASSDDE